ncbi:hypothetical protein EJ05DRAFT_238004 [Pseudovirgaria hyperparasitica]|uniref:Uncharacterized protein n=1 Tax=Pseudovirgaria hyperparasitica TaxID=470096 RepID=A0A6A6VRG9_9PEZI|nr:uncharacterized protein EJ05DRAFT_238004 [Pseudovirgaria hyperparasitica]KAF2752793.1 hypothetical protein EJ05DRAFT_238004 [Pseudovirgaria hyperparasitica]
MATTSTKPALSALKTPLSATYPSELRSPMIAASPALVKRERDDDLKTPITPPTAYMDFLKALSPVLMSPLATGASTKFTFPERSVSASTMSSFGSNGPTSAPMTAKETPSSPVTISSPASRASSCCDSSASKPAAKPEEKEKTTTVSLPPAAPLNPPLSARSLCRLQIPQSPYSPVGPIRSPMSARSVHSPYNAAMSPREFDDKSKSSGTSRAVVVRQVTTRTITYSRTPVDTAPPAPLDPAPKGKRRRIE